MVQLAWGEFNWRPYGGAKLWTYSLGKTELSWGTGVGNGWRIGSIMIPVVEKELVESWSKRFFDETTQEEFERCSKGDEQRYCLRRVFDIRTEEVKNFEEDQ